MLRKLIVVAAVSLSLAGCKSFREGYRKGFIESWEKNFVKSCVGSNDAPEQRELCQCVAARAVSELTVEQLSDVSYTTKYIQDNIMPACQSE